MTFTIRLPKPMNEWQKSLMNWNGKFALYICGTKTGKACSIYEHVPTPSGWKTMGDLKEGDFVFDEHGKPTKILYATDYMFGRKCYRVKFSDCTSVVVDAEHLWLTTTHRDRANIKKQRSTPENWIPRIRTTEDIKNTLTVKIAGKYRSNHAIKNVSAPIQFERQILPLDPYVLGVWLGDGMSNGGELSINNLDTDIIERIRSLGWEVTKKKSADIQWRVVGLTSKLTEMGLIKNKHIPPAYLIGSVEQRLKLLQGLMDTDGTICPKGNCEFDNTIKSITDGVDALAVSLGIKVVRRDRVGKFNGVEHKRCFGASFVTDLPVFHTQRKAQRLRKPSEKTLQRTIRSIEEVDSVPVRCITVESPTHLFLLGKNCIPTHNSLSGSCRILSDSFRQKASIEPRYRIIAPTYKLTGITYRYLDRLVPERIQADKQAQQLWAKHTLERSKGRLEMRWPHNNALIECIHAQDPETTIEGERTHGNVMDELSKMKEQALASTFSTTTQTGGWIRGYSTPRGKKNWVYKLWLKCQNEMELARMNGREPTMIAMTAITESNPFVPKESIEQAKRMLPDHLFRQLYLAEFIDEGSVLSGFRDCIDGELIELRKRVQFWKADNASECSVVLGVDWAKRSDFFVAVAIDPHAMPRPKVVGFVRTQGVQYKDCISLVAQLGSHFKSVIGGRHDRTGVGDVIDEMLAGLPFHLEPVVFTNQTKAFMVERYMVALQSQQLILPNWDDLIKEHDAYDVTTTPMGLPKYEGADGENDDIVTACYLAYSLVAEMRDQRLEVMTLDDLHNTVQLHDDSLESFYFGMNNEEEDD